MMVGRTEIVDYTQEWYIYCRHFYVNYNVSERFYIDLKSPIGVFIPELHLTVPFYGIWNV